MATTNDWKSSRHRDQKQPIANEEEHLDRLKWMLIVINILLILYDVHAFIRCFR